MCSSLMLISFVNQCTAVQEGVVLMPCVRMVNSAPVSQAMVLTLWLGANQVCHMRTSYFFSRRFRNMLAKCGDLWNQQINNTWMTSLELFQFLKYPDVCGNVDSMHIVTHRTGNVCADPDTWAMLTWGVDIVSTYMYM